MLLFGLFKKWFKSAKWQPWYFVFARNYRRPSLFADFFAYSHEKKMVKRDNFQSKLDFLSTNSRFAVQNDGTYKPRITRETCIANILCQGFAVFGLKVFFLILDWLILNWKCITFFCFSFFLFGEHFPNSLPKWKKNETIWFF